MEIPLFYTKFEGDTSQIVLKRERLSLLKKLVLKTYDV